MADVTEANLDSVGLLQVGKRRRISSSIDRRLEQLNTLIPYIHPTSRGKDVHRRDHAAFYYRRYSRRRRVASTLVFPGDARVHIDDDQAFQRNGRILHPAV